MSRHKFRKGLKRKKTPVRPLSPIPSYRLKLTFSILFCALFGLMGRLAWLQLFEGPYLEARARTFQTRKIKPLGKRRSIIDRQGRLVALDEKRFRLYVHPRQFKFDGDSLGVIRTPLEVARKLSPLLPLSTFQLVDLMGDHGTGVKLTENLSIDVASKIQRLRINGIDLEPYLQRVYPQDDLFANVIGFLDYDRNPQAGLELNLNKQLSSNEKVRKLRYGRDGTPLPNDVEPGVFFEDDVRLELSLDARLQEIAVKELRSQIKEWNASKGAVIVMNANTGELLALASTPTYDPNKYWNYSPALYKEWSVEELFEPGSTFKPINLALALQEGVINPSGTVYDSGEITIGGWSLGNWNNKGNGLLDYPRVLQLSSNVAMVKIMKNLSPASYWDWLKKLGVDKKPETDLLGVVGGQLKSKELFVKQPIHQAVASYGQGFSITPLKLVQLHALIANGGKLVEPRITREPHRHVFRREKVLEGKDQLLSPEVTSTVLSWMESVVDSYGEDSVKMANYRIGGKTGTADQTKDGVNYTSKICSFVAILPVQEPRFVVLVVIDNPLRPYAYGSTVAMPVAKKIIESLIVLEKIPPVSKASLALSSEEN